MAFIQKLSLGNNMINIYIMVVSVNTFIHFLLYDISISYIWTFITLLFVYVGIRALFKRKATAKPVRIITIIEIALSIYVFGILGIAFIIILVLPFYIIDRVHYFVYL